MEEEQHDAFKNKIERRLQQMPSPKNTKMKDHHRKVIKKSLKRRQFAMKQYNMRSKVLQHTKMVDYYCDALSKKMEVRTSFASTTEQDIYTDVSDGRLKNTRTEKDRNVLLAFIKELRRPQFTLQENEIPVTGSALTSVNKHKNEQEYTKMKNNYRNALKKEKKTRQFALQQYKLPLFKGTALALADSNILFERNPIRARGGLISVGELHNVPLKKRPVVLSDTNVIVTLDIMQIFIIFDTPQDTVLFIEALGDIK